MLAWWQANAPAGFDPEHELEHFDLFTGFGYEVAQWPEVPLATVCQYIAQRKRFGWPMLALERSVWCDGREAHKDAWKLPFFNDRLEHDLVALKPVWPGFAINALLYAVVLWVLFAASSSARRWRRKRRNLCPACAYPVGASPVCTECGKPVKPRGVESVTTPRVMRT